MRYSEPVNRRLATAPRLRALSLLTSVTLCVLTCGPSTGIADAASSRKLYFYHSDHLGSTSLVTDAQGQVVETIEYAPFGATRVRTGPTTVPHQFTGQRLDAATGLYYYGGRYYDAELGHFTQPDPIVQDPADPQFLNRYAYVRNNPVNMVDPSGNFAFLAFLAAIFVKAIVGAAVGAATSVAVGAATGQIHSAKDVGRFAAVGASAGAFSGVGAFAFGANGLALTGLAKGVASFGTFVGAGAVGAGIDSAMSGGSFGHGALVGTAFGGTLYGIGLGFSAFAQTPLGERLGETALGGLQRLADTSAGRAIQRALGQAGAETAETVASRIPLGFQSASQFTRAANQFIEAAGVDDALVGVRGSAATGVSFETGLPFGSRSDIDLFIVSDKLYKQALSIGAVPKNGAFNVGETLRFPELHQVEEALKVNLGRKVTIRIFSRAGYQAVKAATDIYGQ